METLTLRDRVITESLSEQPPAYSRQMDRHVPLQPPSYADNAAAHPSSHIAGPTSKEEPPTYNRHDQIAKNVNCSANHASPLALGQSTECPHSPTVKPLSLPIVLPQTTKSFRGAFFSPFVRAYTPALEAHSIGMEEFITFIDGLNECFVAHPIYRGLNIVGAVLGMFYSIHPVQFAGMGLQLASGVASAATSYFRTKAYVKAINMDLFHPAGLHVNVMTTKKMMNKVGYPDQKLQLPPLETAEDMGGLDESWEGTNDPRMRRLRALEGYVMPLDFDVPEPIAPDNLLKKMSASAASKMDKKQTKKLMKKRHKQEAKIEEQQDETEKKRREGDREVRKVERKIERERSKLDRAQRSGSNKDATKAVEKFEKEEAKLLADLRKETRKRDKDVAKETRKLDKEIAKVDKKETRTANKIRWIVISHCDEDEDEDEDHDDDKSQSGYDDFPDSE